MAAPPAMSDPLSVVSLGPSDPVSVPLRAVAPPVSGRLSGSSVLPPAMS
jgi:hypothetical protein